MINKPNKLNIDNLRIFVEALNKLPDEVKNNGVDMASSNEPFCNTAGCHSGLISITAGYIPKLESSYKFDTCTGHKVDYEYSHFRWADTLAQFLGFVDTMSLKKWGCNNPELWGNEYGFYMFGLGIAFGEKGQIFKHSVIINHWTEVLKRVENKRRNENDK